MCLGSFVCAMPGDNMQHPCRFRTYSIKRNESGNCKIWEAAHATAAAPNLFKGIEISGLGGIKEFFIGGGIKCNNPVKEVVDEASQIYGDNQHVGVLISLGSGSPGAIGLGTQGSWGKNLISTLMKIANDCEAVAGETLQQFINLPQVYFRFNVEHGMDHVSPEEWERDGEVMAYTKAYLQDSEVSGCLDAAVQHLCKQRQEVTVAALCMLV